MHTFKMQSAGCWLILFRQCFSQIRSDQMIFKNPLNLEFYEFVVALGPISLK